MQRFKLFYSSPSAAWPDYIHMVQGSDNFDPSYMNDRVIFPPHVGEEIHHLGWLHTLPSITNHGLWPGKHWARGREENHGSAGNPRKLARPRPGLAIPGPWPYHGHLQGQNANFVWSNSILANHGILIYQTESYCLVIRAVWPMAALLRVESLDGKVIH